MKHIYVRISTDDKNQTIDTQRVLLTQAHADALFMYSDAGVSGSSLPSERKGWNDLLSMLKPGDQVIVLELSRISRDLDHARAILKEFAKRDITIISLREGSFNWNNEQDSFNFSLLSLLNEREKRVIQSRVKLGMAAAKQRGIHCGRKTSGDKALAEKMLSEGCTLASIVAQTGVSRATVYRIKAELAKEAA